MQRYEYKVIPAPSRGEKARGLKTGAERFAHALEVAMNALGQQGWEYVRADTLPAEERTGFTGRTTVYHNMLVFRRPQGDASAPADAAVTESTPRLSFPRLRIGAGRAETAAPRLTLDQPEGNAPKLGPAADAAAPADKSAES